MNLYAKLLEHIVTNGVAKLNDFLSSSTTEVHQYESLLGVYASTT